MIQYINLEKSDIEITVGAASKKLREGGIIIYPTDTVYGLGVDATNAKAVQSLFQLKGRVKGKGMACVFSSIHEIKKYCHVLDRQEILLRQYLPGPYTFLLNPRMDTQLNNNLFDAKRKTIGVRIIDHPFTRKLSQIFPRPFTTTSANRSGFPAPKTPAEVKQYLLAPIPLKGWDILFIKAEKTPGQPSTVVDLTKTPPEVVRQGAKKLTI